MARIPFLPLKSSQCGGRHLRTDVMPEVNKVLRCKEEDSPEHVGVEGRLTIPPRTKKRIRKGFQGDR